MSWWFFSQENSGGPAISGFIFEGTIPQVDQNQADV